MAATTPTWADKQATALVRAVLTLPPAPTTTHVSPEIFDTKCLCGIKRTVLDFAQRVTPSGVSYRESVCIHCPRNTVLKQWSKLAVVVCVGCRKELIRLSPRKEKSGFEFKAGHTYHVLNCPLCKPGLDRSPFVEQTLYERALYSKKI